MMKFSLLGLLLIWGTTQAYKGGWDPRYCCYPPGDACCPTGDVCDCLDIVMVVDNSSSISTMNWQTYVVPFLQMFADSSDWTIGTGDDEWLVGLVTFANGAKVWWGWDGAETMSNAALSAAFADLANEDPFGATNMGGGFRKARERILESEFNRDSCADVCLVIADGQVMEPPDGGTAIFDVQLPLFRDACDKIIVVGIDESSALDMDQLEEIASGPDYVLTVDEFSELAGLFGSIDGILCPDGGSSSSDDCCPYDEPFYSKITYGY